MGALQPKPPQTVSPQTGSDESGTLRYSGPSVGAGYDTNFGPLPDLQSFAGTSSTQESNQDVAQLNSVQASNSGGDRYFLPNGQEVREIDGDVQGVVVVPGDGPLSDSRTGPGYGEIRQFSDGTRYRMLAILVAPLRRLTLNNFPQ